jgi:hypothetical protein
MAMFRRMYHKFVLPLQALTISEKCQLLFSFVMSLATFAAMASALLSFLQMRETHRDLVTTQRPWMGITVIRLKVLSLDLKNPKASYHIQLKNFGASVATHVAVSARPLVRADQIYSTRQLTCQEAKAWSAARSMFPGQGVIENSGGGIVFPGQEGFAEQDDVRIERPDFDQSRFFLVVGCATYQDAFGEYRETRFIYSSNTDVSTIASPIELTPFLISESPQ